MHRTYMTIIIAPFYPHMHSVVQEIYDHSPGSISYEGACRRTPLHQACLYGHPGIAKFILESNPDINVNVRYAV